MIESILRGAILIRGLRAVFSFFRDPSNQHLATWLQTFAVVMGVVIGLAQLNSIATERAIQNNERYLEMDKQFSSDISRKMGLIYEQYQNRARLSDEEFSALYSLDEILETQRAVEVYLTDLSSCGNLNVCPAASVDSAVCSHAVHLHSLMKQPMDLPEEWKIKLHYPVIYEQLLNEHCGLIRRITYWWGSGT